MNLTEREVEFLRRLCEREMGNIPPARWLALDISLQDGTERSMARDLYFKLAEVPVR